MQRDADLGQAARIGCAVAACLRRSPDYGTPRWWREQLAGPYRSACHRSQRVLEPSKEAVVGDGMRSLVVVLGLLLSLAVPLRGDATMSETLRGLEGLAVQAFVDEGAAEVGFTEEVVKAATEVKLRKNGVVVVDNVAPPPAQRAGLAVRVTTRRMRSGTQLFGIVLGVVQQVQLTRDEKMIVAATTWDLGPIMGVGGPAEMRAALDGELDILSREWLAMHPKSP